MKKLVCIFTVMLCLCVFAVPCFAESVNVIFTLKAVQNPEENVVVSVVSSKDSALYTTEFYITYDEGTVEFVEESAVVGEAVASLNPIVTATKVSPGRVKVSYTGTKPLDISGEICRVEFRALRSAETFLDIEVEHAETFDGEHIRSLTTMGDGTRVMITEQPAEFSVGAIVAIVAAVLSSGVAVAVALNKNKKPKNKRR